MNTPMLPIQSMWYSQGYRRNGNEKVMSFSFQWTFWLYEYGKSRLLQARFAAVQMEMFVPPERPPLTSQGYGAMQQHARCIYHLQVHVGWIQLGHILFSFFLNYFYDKAAGWLPKSHCEEAHASFLRYQQDYCWVFILVSSSIREYNWTLVLPRQYYSKWHCTGW